MDVRGRVPLAVQDLQHDRLAGRLGVRRPASDRSDQATQDQHRLRHLRRAAARRHRRPRESPRGPLQRPSTATGAGGISCATGLKSMGIVVEPPRGSIYVWVPVPEGHTSASRSPRSCSTKPTSSSLPERLRPNGRGIRSVLAHARRRSPRRGRRAAEEGRHLTCHRTGHETRPDRERAVLVGAVFGSAINGGGRVVPRRARGPRRHRRRGPGRPDVAAEGRTGPRDLSREGQSAKRSSMSPATLDADILIFDDELTPAQGRNLEEIAGVNPLAERGLEDHRPHRVDPRHLRPACAVCGRQAAGRARPTQLPVPAPQGLG